MVGIFIFRRTRWLTYTVKFINSFITVQRKINALDFSIGKLCNLTHGQIWLKVERWKRI
jgi:hypothetical protein